MYKRNTKTHKGKRGGKQVYENTTERILKAQNGDEEEMTKLIEENNRINLEHSKKIYRQRL